MEIADKKNDLRKQYRRQRAAADPEERKRLDDGIYRRILSLEEYRSSPTLLTYVSVGSEADTHALIRHAIREGKKVAVPRCVKGTNRMEFYLIDSFESLGPGSYGLLEPLPDPRRLLDSRSGLCILPGLCFDRYGNRLGYGMGFYDRFLISFNGITAGICRSQQLYPGRLPAEKYDRPVSLVITENEIYRPFQ